MTPGDLAGVLSAFGVEPRGAPEPVGGGHINQAWRITGAGPRSAGSNAHTRRRTRSACDAI